MAERVYDKINYQTNFTSTTTFAILLKAVKDNEPVDSEYARATLFPQARSNAGMRYDPNNRDTHGEISLAQYGLIDYIGEKKFKLSAMGNRFLELFNDDFTIKPGNDFNYVSTMVDSLFSWYDKTYARNINVGILLFKLLLDPDLSYYITADEWSFVAEFSGIKTNADYQKLKIQIIDNRNNNANFPLKKADVFLGGLAGTWKLLEKTNVGTSDIYKLKEIAKQIILEKFRQIDEIDSFQNYNKNIDILSPEWFNEKSTEFIEKDVEAEKIYNDFRNKFSPLKLATFNGEELLNYMFLGGNTDNLCHELEYVAINIDLFGSVKNGSSFKYPLFKRNGTWLTGTAKNPISLSLDKAIKIGTEVRDKLALALTTIENVLPLNSVEGYLSLYTSLYSIMPNLVDNLWVTKYFHMFYPSVFPVFYSEDWQLRVLNVLNIEPLDATYGRLGQINLFVKKCDISNVAFGKIFHKYCKNLKGNDNEIIKEENSPIDFDTCERLKNGSNTILYGVPGSGKSWTLNNEYFNDNIEMERVIFHPDYSYSDFIGQILPQTNNGDVKYEFIPGPFTKILKEAYINPSRKFILVIEEINRGNAPAIFGDIFQLLDRNNDGESEYSITNTEIAKIVYKNENHKVSIPSNMSILCTMNTSDQNVFTLDTAFQRRWHMRLIENSFKKDTIEEIEFAEHFILDTNLTWEKFCEHINELILQKNENMTSSEDKRLGTHFVCLDDLIYDENETNSLATVEEKRKARLSNRRFAEKVIKYLWDDAFKFYRNEIFKDDLNSLEKIITYFATNTGDERFDIFKENVKLELLKK